MTLAPTHTNVDGTEYGEPHIEHTNDLDTSFAVISVN